MDSVHPPFEEDSEQAVQVRREIYADMSFAEKWRQVCLLREAAWSVKAAGLRALHPNWSDEQVNQELRRVFLYATT